ncbi:MAG: CopG family transcriptional regulator, partial [Candidatus Gallionella acididurans]
MRALIEIPDGQIAALAAICASEKASRSEIIRRAIALYIEQAAPAPAEAFGLWRGS